MGLKVATTVALGLLLSATAPGHGSSDMLDRLARAAYFSDACRQEAAALGIVPTADADALFAAFARRLPAAALPADPPDVLNPNVLGNDCQAPAVVLINLLRGNGIDAALAFGLMPRANADGEIEPLGKIDRVLVYVPALDRYLDPSAPPARQAVLDSILRERTERTILYGPSLVAGHGACADLCMQVVPPNRADTVRVKTQTIRR
jgi:hypothetical protein